ncbi:MAG: FlgD immunoglobulin-like domain containing protein [bacterium]
MRTLWILFLGILLAAAGLAPAQVMLNEILYDTQSTDDPNLLFTELYGPAGTSLEGYTLVGFNGNGGAQYRSVALSGTIPPDGYFVVGNTSSVPNVDLVVGGGMDGVNWENAGSVSGDDCDCVELQLQGSVVDKVRYGPCANPPGCPGEGGTNAPDPYPSGGINYSIGRIPDHQDTDNNAADWAVPEQLTPGAPNAAMDTCEIHYYTISEVQADNADGTPVHMDEFVHIAGIATISNYILDPTRTSFYIQDEDAGVNIFGSIGTVEVAAGDCVVIDGWISHYNGLCEIISTADCIGPWSLEIVDHVNVPQPLIVTCNTIDQLGEDYEGMLVKIECVTITGGDPWPAQVDTNANIVITDQTGSCIMRIDMDTDIPMNPAPPELFTVIGIVNQFDYTSPYTEYYQLLPRSYSDFTICDAAEPIVETPASFRLLGCFPNPFNAATRISFTVARRGEVSIGIYDLMGREVTRALVSAPSAGDYSYTWNGTNLGGKTVATGLYFVHLKAGTESASSKLLFLK